MATFWDILLAIYAQEQANKKPKTTTVDPHPTQQKLNNMLIDRSNMGLEYKGALSDYAGSFINSLGSSLQQQKPTYSSGFIQDEFKPTQLPEFDWTKLMGRTPGQPATDPKKPRPGGGMPGGMRGGGGLGRNQVMGGDGAIRSPFAGTVPGHSDPWSGWSGDRYDRGGTGPQNNVKSSFYAYNFLNDPNKFDKQIRPDGSILYLNKETGKGVMVPANEWSSGVVALANYYGMDPNNIGSLLGSPSRLEKFFSSEQGKGVFSSIWNWAKEHKDELLGIGLSIYTGNPAGIVVSLLKIGWDALKTKMGGGN